MKGCYERIPKSFLLGLSVAFIICIIGLLVHMSLLNQNSDRDGERDISSKFG